METWGDQGSPSAWQFGRGRGFTCYRETKSRQPTQEGHPVEWTWRGEMIYRFGRADSSSDQISSLLHKGTPKLPDAGF